ncbi:MAG: CPBP family intramembrane metalloprotease [Treponema sp.]|jgi:membrane protease YdiL (CAAX protease family)|nr:CPBP family intramembrane metalloprotease [Treponema sp.]
MNKRVIVLISPAALIAFCSASVVLLHVRMGEWVFIPAFVLYWGISFAITFAFAGAPYIHHLFQKPAGSRIWPIMAIVIGFIPVSILLRNLNIITAPLLLLNMLFALVNPFFEELYWRGFVLDFAFSSKIAGSLYSSVFFIASHLFIWGVFSYGNRNLFLFLSLAIMSAAWCVIRIQTKSLWWCIVSHFLVDVFNLLVFVMLNKYIPEQGYIPQLELLFP